MNLALSVSLTRTTIVLLAWTLIAVLVSFSWSPYGALFMLFGVPAVLSMHFRHEKLILDDFGNLSIRDVLIKQDNISYIYEDPGCIIIQTLEPTRKYMFLGFCSVRPRSVIFKKFYIKNSSDLSRFVNIISESKRDFLFSRILYYCNPF